MQLSTLASVLDDDDVDDELAVSSVVVLVLTSHVVLSPSSICRHNQSIVS